MIRKIAGRDKMIIVLLGPPGTGKGTQAKAIVDRFSLPHISTGDIFRQNLSQGTPLGLEAKGYMEKGELVPDHLVLQLVEDRLKAPDCQGGFLLDGFPRTRVQAEAFDKALKADGREIDRVLLIDVKEEALVRRLSGRRVCRGCGLSYHVDFNPPPPGDRCHCGGDVYQRADDLEEAILNRLRVYDDLTNPLVAYYRAGGKLVAVDGEGSPSEVEGRIARALP
jgi:adenylate kinase